MPEYIVEYNVHELANRMHGGGRFTDGLTEIVRCRDCKYSGYVTEDKLACVNPRFELDCYFAVEPNGFCAWGTRRD